MDAAKEQRIEMIATVYREGMTLGGIAKAVSHAFSEDVSRNVIIGMFNRDKSLFDRFNIDRPARKSPEQRAEAKKRAPKVAKAKLPKREKLPDLVAEPSIEPAADPAIEKLPTPPAVLASPRVRDPDSKNIRLLDLTEHTCKWPTGEDASGHLFCGHHSGPGPYCKKHQQRGTVPYERKFNGKKTA